LIISDEDLNKETGPATDFIVVSSTDPQGGLVMRKPEFPRVDRTSGYADRAGERPYRRSPEENMFRHPIGGFFGDW
jgi:hypothetical protein